MAMEKKWPGAGDFICLWFSVHFVRYWKYGVVITVVFKKLQSVVRNPESLELFSNFKCGVLLFFRPNTF